MKYSSLSLDAGRYDRMAADFVEDGLDLQEIRGIRCAVLASLLPVPWYRG